MEPKLKKYLQNSFKILVSIIILYFLISQIGFDKIIQTLSGTNLSILLLAVPLKIVALLLTTLNISVLLKGIKKKISLWKLFITSNLAWSIGLFLPGRLGEFSLIYFLKKHDVTIGEGTAITLLDKISTFIVLSIISVLAIVTYFDFNTALKFGTILLIILVLSIVMLSSSRIRDFIKKHFLKSYSKLFTGFNESLKMILHQKVLFCTNLLITTIKWFFSFLLIKIIFTSLGVQVSIIDVSFITSLAMLISLIPISIGGLGVRESIAVYLFNNLSVKPEVTLSVYLINTLLNYLFGFLLLLTNLNKLGRKETKTQELKDEN